MANRRINRTKSFSGYVASLNQDVNILKARTNVTGISVGAISGDNLSNEVSLVTSAIQSASYAPNEYGWRIDGSGVAEFADVYVRGDINAETGTIGYWNISSPGVYRKIGNTELFGTFLESSDLGSNDIDKKSGTYVALFKSYYEDPVQITHITRHYNVATVVAPQHRFNPGDLVLIRLENDPADFNTGITPVQVLEVTSTTFKCNSVGADYLDFYTSTDGGFTVGDPRDTSVNGYVQLYVEDVAGLYLQDYGKTNFDYGYFSNKGVAYVSAERINLIYNPSFETSSNVVYDSLEGYKNTVPGGYDLPWDWSTYSTVIYADVDQYSSNTTSSTFTYYTPTGTNVFSVGQKIYSAGLNIITTVTDVDIVNNRFTVSEPSIGSGSYIFRSALINPLKGIDADVVYESDSFFGFQTTYANANSTQTFTGTVDFYNADRYGLLNSNQPLYLNFDAFPVFSTENEKYFRGSVLANTLVARITSATANGTAVVYTVSGGNRLAVSDNVTITGMSNTAYNLTNQQITASNSTSFTVSNALAAGTTTGLGNAMARTSTTKIFTASITNAVGDGNFLTYTANNSFVVGDYVTVTGSVPIQNQPIYSCNATTFTVKSSVQTSNATAGTANVYPMTITMGSGNFITRTIASEVANSTHIVYTTSVSHGLKAMDVINTNSMTPAGLNVNGARILSATANTFTISNSTGVATGSYSSVGSVNSQLDLSVGSILSPNHLDTSSYLYTTGDSMRLIAVTGNSVSFTNQHFGETLSSQYNSYLALRNRDVYSISKAATGNTITVRSSKYHNLAVGDFITMFTNITAYSNFSGYRQVTDVIDEFTFTMTLSTLQISAGSTVVISKTESQEFYFYADDLLYVTRNAYLDLDGIFFPCDNGSALPLRDIITDLEALNWQNTRYRSVHAGEYISQKTGFSNNGRVAPFKITTVGASRSYPVNIQIDPVKLADLYKVYDPVAYAAKSNLKIRMPMFLYDGLGVDAFYNTTKLNSGSLAYSVGVLYDNFYLSNYPSFFYGGSSETDTYWVPDTTGALSTTNPERSSIKKPKTWIDINLSTQKSILRTDYVGFEESNFSNNLFNSAFIGNADLTSPTLVGQSSGLPVDISNKDIDLSSLTVSSGEYFSYYNTVEYSSLIPDWTDSYLIRSYMTAFTGKTQTGIELVARSSKNSAYNPSGMNEATNFTTDGFLTIWNNGVTGATEAMLKSDSIVIGTAADSSYIVSGKTRIDNIYRIDGGTA